MRHCYVHCLTSQVGFKFQYSVSLYFMLTVFTTVGFGDIGVCVHVSARLITTVALRRPHDTLTSNTHSIVCMYAHMIACCGKSKANASDHSC